MARLPNTGGIIPVNWFFERSRTISVERLPTSAGISPLKSLSPSRRWLKFVRRPKDAGMRPVSSLPFRYKRVTRFGVPSTATPSHSVMGVSTDQPSVARPARSSPDTRSASQSDTRPGLLSGSGTATPLAHGREDACSASAIRSVPVVDMIARPTAMATASRSVRLGNLGTQSNSRGSTRFWRTPLTPGSLPCCVATSMYWIPAQSPCLPRIIVLGRHGDIVGH